MHRRILLAAAAGSLAAPAFAQGGKLLRYVPQTDLTVLDPVLTTAYITRHHALMIYDQLFGLDEQLRPQPQMVEAYEQDGLIWRFRLRDGLRFHDGEAVRGRDCIASIRRWAQRDALGQALMARVEEMASPEDRVFTIRLKAPFGPMLEALSKLGPSALFIMPERIAGTDATTAIKDYTGSGPFRFLPNERVSGARVAYARNADYVPRPNGETSWAAGPKRVFFDRVEWIVMPDGGTAAAALRNGEVEWWENPPNDLAPALKRSRDVVVRRANPFGAVGTGIFITLPPPFDKPAVRRAVLGAMSQADIMTAVAGEPEMWRAGVGVFTPGTPLATDVDMAAITGPRDLARSRRELREAGYQGETIIMLAPTDQAVQAAASEVVLDLFKKLEMKVDFRVSDWGTLVQRRASKEPPEKGGWHFFHTTWNGLDAINPGVATWLRANGDRAFFGWPNVPAVERQRLAWFEAPDMAAQQAIAADLQRAVLTEVPFLPTGQYFGQTAYRRTITDPISAIYAFWGVRPA
jgi:peptide/nickel transport system substrate-binding protein